MTNEIQKQHIEQFRDALTLGIEKIYEASKIYVQAIDADPSMKQKFQTEFDGVIALTTWVRFEKVGRGDMHHKLMFGGGKCSSYIKRLAYSDQEKIMDGTPIPLLTSTGDTLMVDAREVSNDQAKQLFAGNVIRPIGKQKAYLESLKTRSAINASFTEVTQQMPYKISGGKVTFAVGCVMTKREVKRMVKELIGK